MAKKKKKSKQSKGNVLLWWLICLLIGLLTQNKKITIILAAIPIILFICKKLWNIMKRFIKTQRYRFSSLARIDQMTGTEFEEFLEIHFKRNGFKVKHIGKTGDFGVDLILIDRLERKIAVQAKRYNGMVGVKSVQEVVSGREYYGCYKAIVVTNSHFTKGAEELAYKCNVELWDRDMCKNTFSLRETQKYTLRKV